MYITCQKCKTSFVVTAMQIGYNGRKVKCSKCKNIWHAYISQDDLEDKIEPTFTNSNTENNNAFSQNYTQGVNLPALLPIKLPAYLCSMPIILIILIIFAYTQFFSEYSSILTSNASYSGLLIKDVNVHRERENDKVTIYYTIFNNSHSTVTIPMIRIRLFDDTDKILQNNVTDATYAYGNVANLAPNRYLTIKTIFTSVPSLANKLDITIGKKIDFFFR